MPLENVSYIVWLEINGAFHNLIIKPELCGFDVPFQLGLRGWGGAGTRYATYTWIGGCGEVRPGRPDMGAFPASQVQQ